MTKKRAENNLVYRILSSPKKRISIFREIPVNNRGFFLLDLSKRLRQEIMSGLNDEELIELVDYLDPDEATDLLQNIDVHRRNKIVKKLSEEMKEKVELLLKFNPRTAAGMMSLDYIEVNEDIAFEELSEIIQKHEKRTGKFPTILVVKDGFLIGELLGHVLALHKDKEKIDKYVKKVPHIKYDRDETEVVSIFKKHPHNKVIILDKDESILGVIYSDDILRLIERRSLNNLSDFAGVSKEEDVLDSALIKVKNRYKWLIINLGTAFLAASVVGLFQETISAFVLLAVYMPVVAGMGGNAGTQTLAVVVRGLALKEIELKTGKQVIINEMLAGGINGIINGVLVAVVATLWNKNPLLGLVIGLAMIVNLIVAGLFGATIPLIMKRLGKDPASSATIFITTATDVFGFFVFLGLATIIL
ncbi:MAG: magnesium transporter [Candidatus Altiarchaeales archaeon]|nr:magnesium transporter [Candidatus Altiarchaeota archaeon]MBU4341396.1 magnesium transporter [Candidatus Altiarchaeota archaeon]MBU4406933.1 magnesium transporter [Candidatus Altiarchaeota archaeon]MBU4437037.1 magnesium transporter [Candidatus Altiarchaeota archaeon]MCG2782594.1 magnesium transporter [Candidatus Altiarchaeales archaeon]